MVRPLTQAPEPARPIPKLNWKKLKTEYEKETGKTLSIVRRLKNSIKPPPGCFCEHCGAPSRYLYLNDGKKGNQVLCKICRKLSATHRVRTESKAKYFCPYCGSAMYLWKQDSLRTVFKCPCDKCPLYLDNLRALTPEEHEMRASGNTSQFKLRYQYQEYHFKLQDLQCARPAFPTKDINLDQLLVDNGFSRRNFFRHWKKFYKLSPSQYIKELKFQYACTQLSETSDPIWKITQDLNFQNSHYLCRIFKERFGISPLQYRKQKFSSTTSIPGSRIHI